MFPPYENIAGHIKSLTIIESPPPEKSPPADNLPVKIRPARGFLPVNCQPGGNFFEGRSYNGAQAIPAARPYSDVESPRVMDTAIMKCWSKGME